MISIFAGCLTNHDRTHSLYECRCDERLRLKPKAKKSTRLAYTGLCGGLEHLKIETRLINDRLTGVMSDCFI